MIYTTAVNFCSKFVGVLKQVQYRIVLKAPVVFRAFNHCLDKNCPPPPDQVWIVNFNRCSQPLRRQENSSCRNYLCCHSDSQTFVRPINRKIRVNHEFLLLHQHNVIL